MGEMPRIAWERDFDSEHIYRGRVNDKRFDCPHFEAWEKPIDRCVMSWSWDVTFDCGDQGNYTRVHRHGFKTRQLAQRSAQTWLKHNIARIPEIAE